MKRKMKFRTETIKNNDEWTIKYFINDKEVTETVYKTMLEDPSINAEYDFKLDKKLNKTLDNVKIEVEDFDEFDEFEIDPEDCEDDCPVCTTVDYILTQLMDLDDEDEDDIEDLAGKLNELLVDLFEEGYKAGTVDTLMSIANNTALLAKDIIEDTMEWE